MYNAYNKQKQYSHLGCNVISFQKISLRDEACKLVDDEKHWVKQEENETSLVAREHKPFF